MPLIVLNKLLALFCSVALGWVAGRLRWLGEPAGGINPARLLGNAAFYIFVPALLFRTMARLNVASLPWATVLVFFVPVLGMLLTVLTVLVELDLARARAQHEATASLLRTLRQTLCNTVIHPVVLPVLAGLLWHATGWPLLGVLDETLLLGTAVAPLCLVLIGITLAYTAGKTVAGAMRAALGLALLKLLGLPALVLAVAHWGFGLSGLPLQVVVLTVALPSGSNALIFAQRYRAQEAETTTAIVPSTLGFAFTAPLWLALLVGLG